MQKKKKSSLTLLFFADLNTFTQSRVGTFWFWIEAAKWMKMSVGATYTGRVCEIMSCEESKKCLHLQISPIDLDVMYSLIAAKAAVP